MSEQTRKSHIPNRLAIIRDGVDLLRIIPTRKEGVLFDFKVAFLDCDCEAYTYSLLHTNPLVAVIDDARNASITYHHGEGGKDVVIHVKRNDKCMHGRQLESRTLLIVVCGRMNQSVQRR